MKKDVFIKTWLFILVLILISLSIWGIFYIEKVDAKISVLGIVAVIVAAFTSVMTVNLNNKKTREREYELHLLKEKQKVCEHFYNAFFEIFKNVKNSRNGLTKKTLDEMSLFKKGLMNWGSEELIKNYIEYEDNIDLNKGDTYAILNNANTFLKEMRKELGFKDSKKLKLMTVLLTAEARVELRQ
ncbi:hypothetical protein Q4517_15345 [Tenacibaculum sp. 1_MG-2023]|uniref:hypothetical protein n=1 Tax=Tenacibaculum sp. 1_MG-2023 TaxID=3062653 RepID=UPI0026E1E623|nr:hypothetical protein [Tenacibaculum sp. 1_MG-2023]MDO6676912.1 hypothetical protein [Tenacibaculum sp. 1_MG-2023]